MGVHKYICSLKNIFPHLRWSMQAWAFAYIFSFFQGQNPRLMRNIYVHTYIHTYIRISLSKNCDKEQRANCCYSVSLHTGTIYNILQISGILLLKSSICPYCIGYLRTVQNVNAEPASRQTDGRTNGQTGIPKRMTFGGKIYIWLLTMYWRGEKRRRNVSFFPASCHLAT